jgi:hypothetical protein
MHSIGCCRYAGAGNTELRRAIRGVAIRRSVLPAKGREPTECRRLPANVWFALSLEILEWMANCSRLD